jgi:hypothetical protein
MRCRSSPGHVQPDDAGDNQHARGCFEPWMMRALIASGWKCPLAEAHKLSRTGHARGKLVLDGSAREHPTEEP